MGTLCSPAFLLIQVSFIVEKLIEVSFRERDSGLHYSIQNTFPPNYLAINYYQLKAIGSLKSD